jgi:hypothetical protein
MPADEIFIFATSFVHGLAASNSQAVCKASQRLASVLARLPAGPPWILTMRSSVAGSGFGGFGSGGVCQTKGLTGLMAVTGRTGLGLYATVVLTYVDGFLVAMGVLLVGGGRNL